MDKERLLRDKGIEIGELSLQAKVHEELLASTKKAAGSCGADFPSETPELLFLWKSTSNL